MNLDKRLNLNLLRRMTICGLFFVTPVFCSEECAQAANFQTIDIKPGETVDVYLEINLQGSVAVRIATQTGAGCAELWWIEWPLGSVQSLGRHCGTTRIPIPGLSQFAFAAKLRAAGVNVPTKIVASATESVANSVRLGW
jgi:hypothetical protein